MKSKAIVSLITAAALSFGSLSFAQGYERRGPGDAPARVEQRGAPQRDDHRGNARGPDARRYDQARRDGDRHRDARDDRNFHARGPQFHRGGRLPDQYRHGQYVVRDWRGQHLRAPARGQQWVQVGADYALIAIATGVIAQLILAH